MSSLIKSIKNLENVLDLAVLIEQKGRDFYATCRAETDNPELTTLFSFLAAEEEKHLGSFRLMIEGLKPDSFQQDELVGEYGMFIEMIAGETLKHLTEKPLTNVEEAVNRAIRFEKDTLLIYYDIMKLLGVRGRGLIEEICLEEKKHLEKLIQYIKQIR